MTDDVQLTSRNRFRRALACEPVDRPPAWIMRQAGRYLPEYRELRQSHSFLESVHDPELAARITLQPMERFPLDAAVIFSDILIVLAALGQEVTFPPGGPVISPTLGDADVSKLRRVDAAKDFDFLTAALGIVRERLGDERALLGFAGAPFTLACYAVQGSGSKEFAEMRGLLYRDPGGVQRLLDHLAGIVTELLLAQLEAGADAVQLFDTWSGLLSKEDYRRHVAPSTARIVSAVQEAGGRIVLYVRGGAHLVDAAIDSGADAVGLDWRVDLDRAVASAAGRCAVQGNLDPCALQAPAEEIAARVRDIHQTVGGRTGHVFNLGHGIHPTTPIEGVEAFLAAVGKLGEPAP